jgi:hypothetical protein
LNAASKIVINHFGGLVFIDFFLHMLNYSCVNSYLFNRIPWLLVSHITSLYLLSNKDVIRAIYIKKNIYAGIFFTEATTSVAPMKDTPLNVDHIYIIVEVILLIVDCGRRTKCYLTRVIQIELSRFGKVLINIHLNTVEWITWICLVLWCLTPLSSIFQLYRCGHFLLLMCRGWSWSYGSWICNCLCNQCLSSLMLWVRIPLMASCTRYNSMW